MVSCCLQTGSTLDRQWLQIRLVIHAELSIQQRRPQLSAHQPQIQLANRFKAYATVGNQTQAQNLARNLGVAAARGRCANVPTLSGPRGSLEARIGLPQAASNANLRLTSASFQAHVLAHVPSMSKHEAKRRLVSLACRGNAAAAELQRSMPRALMADRWSGPRVTSVAQPLSVPLLVVLDQT